jgi:hypothetical protein
MKFTEQIRHFGGSKRYQKFPGKNFIQLTPTRSTGTMRATGLDGNIFSIRCSVGQILLHFLKVILTAMA